MTIASRWSYKNFWYAGRVASMVGGLLVILMMFAYKEAQNLVDLVRNQYPCIKSANFDILIPWKGKEADFLPVRTALTYKGIGIYHLPDILLVNEKLPSKSRSPLLQFVVKEDIDKYYLFQKSPHLALYVRKEVLCHDF